MKHTRLVWLGLLGCGPVLAPPEAHAPLPVAEGGPSVHDEPPQPVVDGGPPPVVDAGAPGVPDAGPPLSADAGAVGCPYVPPPLERLGLTIHNKIGSKYVIDSTPKTCDRAFCALQDRLCCPVAPEGSPHRAACEATAMGRASDGVFGPEWSLIGSGRVQRHPSNPYLAFAWYPGTVRACVPKQPAVCGELVLPPP